MQCTHTCTHTHTHTHTHTCAGSRRAEMSTVMRCTPGQARWRCAAAAGASASRVGVRRPSRTCRREPPRDGRRGAAAAVRAQPRRRCGQGWAQPRRRCGSREPSPGADVGRGVPSPGADVAALSQASRQGVLSVCNRRASGVFSVTIAGTALGHPRGGNDPPNICKSRRGAAPDAYNAALQSGTRPSSGRSQSTRPAPCGASRTSCSPCRAARTGGRHGATPTQPASPAWRAWSSA